jgi:hypothetical protein
MVDICVGDNKYHLIAYDPLTHTDTDSDPDTLTCFVIILFKILLIESS